MITPGLVRRPGVFLKETSVPALYRASLDLFLGNVLVKAGAIFEWKGKPSIHMQPINAEAQAIFEAAFGESPARNRVIVVDLPKVVDKGHK